MLPAPLLPDLQNEPRALVLVGAQVVVLSQEGECDTLTVLQARKLTDSAPVLLCHRKLIGQRLGCEPRAARDILELWAFVHPVRFTVPTPKGLAEALDLPLPESAEAEALTLWQAQEVLLGQLSDLDQARGERAASIALQMKKGGWNWAAAVLSALGHPTAEQDGFAAMASWRLLPEWAEFAPPPAQDASVEASESRQRLSELLAKAGRTEPRPQQSDYASALAHAFSQEGGVVLAEAGTGVGKTLGYLAPATLWAERAESAVWLSTYTRNLQRQIEEETARLYPDERERVVIRKGRENYLCLLNYEEAVRSGLTQPQNYIPLGLIARWLEATKDGDIKGGDMSGWLPDLIGRNRTTFLADRRGECVHGACPHFKSCFIERSIRRARKARLVIANHALLMNAAASGGIDEAHPPSRFVFDEGHHLFHAADSAFGSDLSGLATYDLRRWILGGEGRSKGRVRGLSKRAEPLLPDGEEGMVRLDSIKQLALVLPGESWLSRVDSGEPRGPVEHFLFGLRALVMARDKDADSPYSLECTTEDFPATLIELADKLRLAFASLESEVSALARLFERRLEKEEETLEDDEAKRIASLVRTLNSYIIDQLRSWMHMLENLKTSTPPEFVDWCGVDRIDSRMVDVGLFRRFLDPTKPFIEAITPQAKGMVITSATLTDPEQGWAVAEAETGAVHLSQPALRAQVLSPFNYAEQTRVLVITDVPMKDDQAVARAYRDLFLASGGGALGLFTAIERLKRVQTSLLAPLAAAHLPLYAQHVDGIDTHTLIDIFRAEGNACLLGTDAVRDGVDVPGRALRLIVFDRVPWPRTDLLLKARKAAFGGSDYVERLTRQKLRQAFGRLIRRADDRGVFVLLSPLPSRLYSSFPGVTPERVTLAEAVVITKNLLNRVDSEALAPL